MDKTEIDLKLINILINNRRELTQFSITAAEGIFDQEYRRFVKNLLNYQKSYDSPPTLDTFLEFCGNNSNLKDYIKVVWDKAIECQTDSKEYSFLLDKINKRYNSEILHSVKEKLSNLEDLDEANNFIYKAANEIRSIGENKTKSECTLKNSVNEYFEKFKAKQQNKELNQGILSGFSVFDYYTNGIKGGEAAIIAAATGCGKSIFMLNYGVNAWLGKNKFPKDKAELNNLSSNNSWKNGNNVLYFSLEMPKDELQDRLISNLCLVDSLQIAKGDISETEAERMSLALNFWKRYPYEFKIIDIPNCTIHDMQDVFDETVNNEFKPSIVIVDYMQIMANGLSSDGNEEADWKNLLDISKDLFVFARTNNVALLTASQLTISQSAKGTVGAHRLSRSKQVLSNFNFALQIEDSEGFQDRPDATIHCIKNRRGQMFKMNLLKEFYYSRFVDQPVSNIENAKSLKEEDLSESIDKIFGQEEISLE